MARLDGRPWRQFARLVRDSMVEIAVRLIKDEMDTLN